MVIDSAITDWGDGLTNEIDSINPTKITQLLGPTGAGALFFITEEANNSSNLLQHLEMRHRTIAHSNTHTSDYTPSGMMDSRSRRCPDPTQWNIQFYSKIY